MKVLRSMPALGWRCMGLLLALAGAASCGSAETNTDSTGAPPPTSDGTSAPGAATVAMPASDSPSPPSGGSSPEGFHTIDIPSSPIECGDNEIVCNGTCVSEGGGEKNGCTLLEWTTVIRDMLLVGDQLYVASVGSVSRMNTRGELEIVAVKGSAMQGAVRLAAIGDTIYFAQDMGADGYSIFQVADTEEPLTIAEGLPPISDFVGGGQTLLLAITGDEGVQLVSYDLGTGGMQTVGTELNKLGADDSHFYWTAPSAPAAQDEEPAWSILRAPVEAPAAVEVFFTAPELNSLSQMWITDDSVVFREWSGTFVWLAKDGGLSSGTVSRSRSGGLQISGKAILRIHEAKGEYADGLWGNRLSTDSPDGGEPLFLGSWEEGGSGANFFVADEQFAYFQVGLTLYRIRVR